MFRTFGDTARSQGPDIDLGLRSLLPVSATPGMDAPTLVPDLEGEMDPPSTVPLDPVLEVESPERGWDRVCFSCGHQGHQGQNWGTRDFRAKMWEV